MKVWFEIVLCLIRKASFIVVVVAAVVMAFAVVVIVIVVCFWLESNFTKFQRNTVNTNWFLEDLNLTINSTLVGKLPYERLKQNYED